ncbi:MAG: type II toxin-antitoxin system YafQ family toxin [Bacteroidota bacterium]
MFTIEFTGQFKRDIKRLEKQGISFVQLKIIIEILEAGSKLPEKYLDHKLKGNKKQWNECHVTNDLCLIYMVDLGDSVVILGRIGSHSELF